MSDWLAELRESKQQAIERMQAEVARGEVIREATEEQLQSEQSQLVGLVQIVQAEQLLAQFVSEILRDHPFFSSTTLTRTVRSKAVGSTVELTEQTPWSGPVETNPLPEHLDLEDSHYAVAIDWKLQSNYRGLHEHEIQPYRLRVSMSANQVIVDEQPLVPQTTDALQSRLTAAFKSSLEHFDRRRSRRRRQRPWYINLWRTFFPRTKPSIPLLITAVAILILAVVVAVVVGPLIANYLPRTLPSTLP